MSYIVFARQYRSQNFTELVGQKSVTDTLLHAIEMGRVAHAYLFTGTRGVGKTSAARLLARALNAPDTLPNAPRGKGDTHEFPGFDVQQRMADAIMKGTDLNVIEIDGASHRSVSEARDLISRAVIAPTGSARYKVYIIDEVHMLTTEAFNTLLKTMEEPPEHVKFILCTTEPHKIPATIRSRCQSFNFQNIPLQIIVNHLANILEKEQIEAETAALLRVATMANGSMRDALSLLDRLVATGEQPLTLVALEQLLGLPPSEALIDLAACIGQQNVTHTLQMAENIQDNGIAIEQLLEALLMLLRDVMVYAACHGKIDMTYHHAEESLGKIASGADPLTFSYVITLTEATLRQVKAGHAPRAMLDALLVRLCYVSQMAQVAALQEETANRISREKKKPLALKPVANGASASTLAQTVKAPPVSVAREIPKTTTAPIVPVAAPAAKVDTDTPSTEKLSPEQAFAQLLKQSRIERKLSLLATGVKFKHVELLANGEVVYHVEVAPEYSGIKIKMAAGHVTKTLTDYLEQITGQPASFQVHDFAVKVEEVATLDMTPQQYMQSPSVQEVFNVFPNAHLTKAKQIQSNEPIDEI